MSLAREMSQKGRVDFIAFRKLYPEFLYPGGISDNDERFQISETATLTIRRIITYYNPISWLRAGVLARGKIVHLQWWSIPLAPIYICLLLVLKLRRKKIVFTVHNILPHETNKADRILTKAVLSFGDGYIVHASSNRDSLISNFRLTENAIHKVHMPVHDMYEGGELDRNSARKEIGIPSDAKVILSFGNLREYKGIDKLIMALSIIAEVIPDVHLLIVGQSWVKWDPYEQLITDLNLETRVTTVLKYVPMSEVKKYFVVSDIVTLPYKRFDAQSGVGNIALAFGLPLVVSRVGGLPELVNDDRVIVEPNDEKSLANSIMTIFLNDKLYEKLQDDAKILKQKYSWASAIDTTILVYKSILANGR
jgi:glycosyltransferase involved in cell wall biosynthesis